MPRRLLFSIVLVFGTLSIRTIIEAEPSPPLAKADSATASVTDGPPLPTGRGSHAGAVLDGHVVVLAGGSAWSKDGSTKHWLSDTLLYRDGQWTAGPSLPHPTAESAFASDGSHLYVVGGLTEVDKPSADAFDLSLDRNGTMKVATLPPLPVRIEAGRAAILNGQLFVAGGYANGKVGNKMWMLDLNRWPRAWNERSPFPAEPRAYPAFAAAAGRLYLIGGMAIDRDTLRVFKDVLRYNPKTDTWSECGELPSAGYCWAAIPVNDEQTHLLIGGRADGVIHDDLWIVDTADLSVRGIGRSVVSQTCAPLVRIDHSTYWLLGGEPSNKRRTERVSQIRLPQ